MTALTKHHRETIQRELLLAARSKRKEAIDKKQNELIHKALLMHFGKDFFERVEAMPEGWLPKISDVAISLLGVRQHHSLPEAIPLPAFLDARRYKREADLSIPTKLVGAFQECIDARDQMRRDEHDLYSRIRSALAPYRTLEKLKEGWPEAYNAIPKEQLGGQSQLPAVRAQDVNKWLKLFQAGKPITNDEPEAETAQ